MGGRGKGGNVVWSIKWLTSFRGLHRLQYLILQRLREEDLPYAVMTTDYIAYPSHDDEVKGYIILN